MDGRKSIAIPVALGLVALLLAGRAALPIARADAPARVLPAPATDIVPAPSTGLQHAVFAGGCFWGVQAVFQHTAGVTQVSGYSGGDVANPSYEQVGTGTTGHAEAVRVTFDPAVVSYGALLQVFFSVALDPTQVGGQGPDMGTQYRSELFVDGPEQERVARAYVAQLDAAHVFAAPIATKVDPATAFYPAEAYHQDYLILHPHSGYIAAFDIPKVEALHALFPERWRDTPARVAVAASGS